MAVGKKVSRESQKKKVLIDFREYIYEGNFLNGMLHGYGNLYFIDKCVTYKGNFYNGYVHGWGTLEYELDQTYYQYQGQFKNSKIHGTGIIYDKTNNLLIAEGDFYEGNYMQPKPEKKIKEIETTIREIFNVQKRLRERLRQKITGGKRSLSDN